ncbi:MAG: LysR family transcriptional regulator [Pararobbsia sp.]
MDPASPQSKPQRRLRLQQLRLLVSLDETRNMARSADVLGMSQPAASRVLRELEELMDIPLFDRLPRGLQPTWFGDSMIRHARTALSAVDHAFSEIAAMKSGLTGVVRVGTIMSPATALIPDAVVRIKQRFPDVRLIVRLESSDTLFPMLRQGELDVVIARPLEEDDNADIEFEPLGGEDVCAMVRVDHPLAHAADVTLGDLARWPWVVPEAGSVLRRRFDQLFRVSRVNPPVDFVETGAQLLITSLVGRSDTVALLPREVTEYYARHGLGAQVPIALDCRMDPFGIATLREARLSPAAFAVLETIRERASELYPEGQG